MPICLLILLAGAAESAEPVKPNRDAAGYSMAKVGILPITAGWGNPIVFTEQVIAFEGDANQMKAANFEQQFTNCLTQLSFILRNVQCDFTKLLRLNLYLESDQDRVRAQAYIDRLLPGTTSQTFVTGKLEHTNALVAMDAIGLTMIPKKSQRSTAQRMNRLPQGRHGLVARLLMPQRQLFISGQAVRADSLREATRATMTQLGKLLRHMRLEWQDVVQVKSFMQPMSEVSSVSKEISSFFETNRTPPQVFVEWTSKVPIEIELVVNGGAAEEGDPLVEYLTPPGMSASPVFTRVVRVNRGKLIFTSSLYGPTDRGAKNEIRSIFEELQLSMSVMGTDLNHLVKATYYVADNESSLLLNQLRPDYYDPKRPPAASKAAVRGAGLPNHRITLDMIGVAE